MILKELNIRCLKSHLTLDSELLFEFEGFVVVVIINFKNDFELIEDTNYNLHNDNSTFQDISDNISEIVSIFIKDYEYLGDREDIGSYTEPSSISYKMFQFLRIIHEIDTKLVKSYRLTTDFPDPMCASQPNYLFEIEIVENAKSIFAILSKLTDFKTDFTPFKHYWFFYKRNEGLDDLSSLNILTTNTKARRLGYLKLVSNFFFEEGKIPLSRINKKFEKFSSQDEIKQQLDSYKYNKGEIKVTKTGISASPYIDLSENLDFISKINNVYSVGKPLRVYQTISEEIRQNENNIFQLSAYDKLFFLESFFNSDFLFLTVLLELIYVQKITTYSELKRVFQKHLIERVNHHLSGHHLSGSIKRQILVIRNRISEWKKPEVYLEHVLMPRLNWLLDLDLIVIGEEKNVYQISFKGEIFFKNLCCWYDIETDFILSPFGFTQRFIQHAFASLNEVETNIEDKENLYKEIDFLLDKSFDKFKTLAPNRTTLSQAIAYVKYSIFLKKNIPIEYKFIENYIKEKAKEKYIYKYQHQYKDGYLQKK